MSEVIEGPPKWVAKIGDFLMESAFGGHCEEWRVEALVQILLCLEIDGLPDPTVDVGWGEPIQLTWIGASKTLVVRPAGPMSLWIRRTSADKVVLDRECKLHASRRALIDFFPGIHNRWTEEDRKLFVS